MRRPLGQCAVWVLPPRVSDGVVAVTNDIDGTASAGTATLNATTVGAISNTPALNSRPTAWRTIASEHFIDGIATVCGRGKPTTVTCRALLADSDGVDD